VTASPAGASTVPRAPHLLPGDAAAASVRAAPHTWLVGARPGVATARIAGRHGARRIALGLYVVARSRARALVRDLRAAGRDAFSEPDAVARPRAIEDPLMLVGQNWRDYIAKPDLVPPAVSGSSPLLALVDSQVDLTLPEWQGADVQSLTSDPVTDFHGTAVAAVAGAPQNGVGVVGVWPGARIMVFPIAYPTSCSAVVTRIGEAIKNGASVINMSFGAPAACYSLFVALEFAVGRGILPVAAAGNEFDQGNPIEFPADFPHVFTVAAIGPDLTSALFSNENPGVDASAPGASIVTAVPLAFDDQPPVDGYMTVDGTSFASPAVAAAAAWVRAARPDLDGFQTGELLRETAQDLGSAGWDPSTGWGLVQVDRALSGPAPARDVGEPNDDLEWVNGKRLGKPDKAVWSGRAPVVIGGLLDKFEDPVDAYRIVMPARSRVRVALHSIGGDGDLAVYDSRAPDVGSRRHLVAHSIHSGTAADEVRVVNRLGTRRVLYVVAYIDARARALTAGYRLSVRRVAAR
jgi:Subtilase family